MGPMLPKLEPPLRDGSYDLLGRDGSTKVKGTMTARSGNGALQFTEPSGDVGDFELLHLRDDVYALISRNGGLRLEVLATEDGFRGKAYKTMSDFASRIPRESAVIEITGTRRRP